MEWEPEGRDAWVLDAERWIGQIRGVSQCKIDIDSEGEIAAVHVVAGMDREPRHIVRDVEGLLKARLGLSVFYKKIGVVQVMDSEPGDTGRAKATKPPVTIAKLADTAQSEAPRATKNVDANAAAGQPADAAIGAGSVAAGSVAADPVVADPLATDNLDSGAVSVTSAVLLAEEVTPRLQCSGVGVMASDLLVRAEVELQAGAVEARGTEEAPNHSESDMTVIARATVGAVRQLLDEPVLLTLSEVKLSSIGGQSVVMVAVELVEGRKSERLVGTCPTSHNRQQAVVYAVLDALNRRLSLMTLKAEEAIN